MLLECLIIRMKNACVDLIIEVLKLLTVLLKLQAKNRGNRSLKHSTPTCDEIDLPTVLRNPKLEPDLCLNLACEVLKNASPFKLREKTIFQLMLALTGFSYDAKRLTRSYVCINEIIKQHRWMVNCPFLSSFVEYR
ncbi:uncharacterized protein LOC132708306 [Cylas formicarius]|uniref:uncharacterized protein LOC132708306 n=1 Tax=Cylas formicarius TaxID=197179 RepID=UPI002958DCBE|nr:uncharacterized protein LOC132708306 [Cylas formicarius]